jgi:hypothetical protein
VKIRDTKKRRSHKQRKGSRRQEKGDGLTDDTKIKKGRGERRCCASDKKKESRMKKTRKERCKLFRKNEKSQVRVEE